MVTTGIVRIKEECATSTRDSDNGDNPSDGTSPITSNDVIGRADRVLVYLDAQFDHIQGRICSLAALAVAYKGITAVRSREAIYIANAAPETQTEERMLWCFSDELFRCVADAAGDPEIQYIGGIPTGGRGDEGTPGRVQLRFVHYDRARPLLLEAIARHYDLASPRPPGCAPLALYDLLTRARSSKPGAAGESALVTCIAADELPRRACPVTCQSLQTVAAWAGFRWPGELKHTFRFGHFDAIGRQDTTGHFYCRRSRHSSQLPDEYFWAAWGRLPVKQKDRPKGNRRRDEYAPFRRATLPLLENLVRSRLAALSYLVEHWQAEDIASGRSGLGGSDSLAFDPLRLANYDDCCHTLIDALTEAVSLERRTRLAEWMSDHIANARTRALSGISIFARYQDADQGEETCDRNRANIDMRKAGERWSAEGLRIVLRLESLGGSNPSEAKTTCPFASGDRVLVSPVMVCDMRLPPEERQWHPPSARQLLYAARAEVIDLDEERSEITLIVRECPIFNGDPFVFPSVAAEPFEDGQTLVLDADPNDGYLYVQWRMLAALRETLGGAKAGNHPLYERLDQRVRVAGGQQPEVSSISVPLWPADAAAGQREFLLGLGALQGAGLLNEEYDTADKDYISSNGTDPMLLVQGPPGTGKTAKTVWMVLARLQGAIRAGIMPFRVAYCANTHAAVDVAAGKMADSLEILRRVRDTNPALFNLYFDSRLLDVALFRTASPLHDVGEEEVFFPHVKTNHPITLLGKGRNKGIRGREGAPSLPANADMIASEGVVAVVFGTPGGLYGLWKERWQRKGFLKRYGMGLLVVDECSRLTLPELLMAAVSLREDGALVAVGDPRQTAPIRAHDFEAEPRRTFKRFPVAASSVFDALREVGVPLIRFSRSWRCNPAIARFLSDSIYHPLDGIDYEGTGGAAVRIVTDNSDPFLTAALSPSPITLILHDEAESEKENAFEAMLVAELIGRMTREPLTGVGSDRSRDIGVVVPHRAQRRLVRAAIAEHIANGGMTAASIPVTVDTVERFQGGEREVILLGATESDPLYLREASVFFYDARRLCVALSRAKAKVIIVASKNVFRLENASDEAFEGALLWQRLKRNTCTKKLWRGERNRRGIEVWATG